MRMRVTIAAAAAASLLFVQLASAQSETPQKFTPVTDTFDYVRREVMIPMRDGVKLKTVIVVPRGAKNAPILLTRTPYDVGNRAPQRARTSPRSSRGGRR